MASSINMKKMVPESDTIERTKQILFLKGKQTSEVVKTAMKDLSLLAKPHCKNLTRNNDILPFEDTNSLEFLGSKNDTGLIVLGSHTKKRPNNLIIGRLYEQHILDMYEFGITRYRGIEEFPGNKKAFGAKPMIVFLGEQWQQDVIYSKIQNLFVDLFRGYKADKLCLTGVDHVISCICKDGNIFIRGYYVNYQSSGSNVPNVVLKPMGPHFDLTVRRTQTAPEDLWKTACRKPKK
jgi:ribosome production factor 2